VLCGAGRVQKRDLHTLLLIRNQKACRYRRLVVDSAGRGRSLASLVVAIFELPYESVSIDVGEWILPPVRVVVDRG
jgi:hypothetical protein